MLMSKAEHWGYKMKDYLDQMTIRTFLKPLFDRGKLNGGLFYFAALGENTETGKKLPSVNRAFKPSELEPAIEFCTKYGKLPEVWSKVVSWNKKSVALC
jgi:hypothetical protein